MEKDSSKKTVYVFIDASNLWEAQKSKGKSFNYEKLKLFLKDSHRACVIKVFYYTAYPANGTREYNLDGKHKFFTYLKKALGFIVRKKELKRILIHNDGCDLIKEKGNMDVEMTIDAIHFKKEYNEAILFTGDSDFLALINYLKNAGKRIYVYSSENNVSNELRTGADGYIDVLKIESDIWGRDLRYRNQK
jgi:uncharacterized LabA/DUF88 family protein